MWYAYTSTFLALINSKYLFTVLNHDRGETQGGVWGVTTPKILETPIGRAIRGIGRAIVFMILLINIHF